jgi:hypothetical protein
MLIQSQNLWSYDTMATLWDIIQILESPFEASWKFSRPWNVKVSLKRNKGDHELVEKMETMKNVKSTIFWDITP